MKTFLRGLDRALIHFYSISALIIACAFFVDGAAYRHASFEVMKVQAQATVEIARALSGLKI